MVNMAEPVAKTDESVSQSTYICTVEYRAVSGVF